METIKQILNTLNIHLDGLGIFSIDNGEGFNGYITLTLNINNSKTYSIWPSFDDFMHGSPYVYGSRLMVSFLEFVQRYEIIRQKLNIEITNNVLKDFENVKSPEEYAIKLNLLGIS